jgi:hypothetical protein
MMLAHLFVNKRRKRKLDNQFPTVALYKRIQMLSTHDASWIISPSPTLLPLYKQVLFMEVKKAINGELWERVLKSVRTLPKISENVCHCSSQWTVTEYV